MRLHTIFKSHLEFNNIMVYPYIIKIPNNLKLESEMEIVESSLKKI